MSEPGRVLLTGYCKRSQHVMFRVLDTPAGLVVVTKLFCAGREYETWTPRTRALVVGQGMRYGCPCRRTALIDDDQMLDAIRRGDVHIVVDAYNISRR